MRARTAVLRSQHPPIESSFTTSKFKKSTQDDSGARIYTVLEIKKCLGRPWLLTLPWLELLHMTVMAVETLNAYWFRPGYVFAAVKFQRL